LRVSRVMGATAPPICEGEIDIMTEKPMLKSEPGSYARQPKSTPMPAYPIPRAAITAMPAPARMPVPYASSSANPQRPASEATKVIAMDDYPAGRGGMRMARMVPPEQPAQPAVRSSVPIPRVPIGARPPATKMPTNP
jgi:hypothetical protein